MSTPRQPSSLRDTQAEASGTQSLQRSATACSAELFAELERALSTLSGHADCILGAKGLDSRHVAATDAYAQLVGLRQGSEVCGRLDVDMPCEGTARFASAFVAEDRAVLARATAGTDNPTLKTVNIHHYGTGLAAWMFDKRPLFDRQRRTTLGTIYSARQIDAAPLLSLLLGGAARRDPTCSLRLVEGGIKLGGAALTPHEHEIGYLLSLGWTPGDINRLLDHIRPAAAPRSADSVYKCRTRICEKLDVSGVGAKDFREMIVAAGIGGRFPASLIEHFVGSTRVA